MGKIFGGKTLIFSAKTGKIFGGKTFFHILQPEKK
jgi:hypothetical protein